MRGGDWPACRKISREYLLDKDLTIGGHKDKIMNSMKKADINIQETIQRLRDLLAEEKGVLFAYLHGSIVQADEFRDVDIGVYLVDSVARSTDGADYEISLSLRLEKGLGLPVDVKILNNAPLSFQYHVSRGILFLDRNPSIRENFLQRTWSGYFDFLPLARIYLEELTRA
jgi:predicted nucleotidyltransferase